MPAVVLGIIFFAFSISTFAAPYFAEGGVNISCFTQIPRDVTNESFCLQMPCNAESNRACIVDLGNPLIVDLVRLDFSRKDTTVVLLSGDSHGTVTYRSAWITKASPRSQYGNWELPCKHSFLVVENATLGDRLCFRLSRSKPAEVRRRPCTAS